jgi:MoaA/NifB/PqqE/SkfB family radical SAM enzyme
MIITGLHLLLTYQCTLECDHCFVWGSPYQTGTMSLSHVDAILRQAQTVSQINSIYFEGGEPFLYYATLLAAVRKAHRMGYSVGIVSNGYWATSPEDALEALRPLAGMIQDLSISSDHYHWNAEVSQQVRHIRAAAEHLGLPLGTISIGQPGAGGAEASGQLAPGESAVMYRGRAAEKLAGRAPAQPWDTFGCCPHEDLRDPGRLHVDPYGNVHLCQGLVLGNLFETPLGDLCAKYDPEAHPIVGALLAGGPAELVRRYDLPHAAGYADACHLCDEARRRLRPRFPGALAPDQMYGVPA